MHRYFISSGELYLISQIVSFVHSFIHSFIHLVLVLLINDSIFVDW